MRKIIVTTKKVTQASVSISKGGYHPLTPNMSTLALTLILNIISFFRKSPVPFTLKGGPPLPVVPPLREGTKRWFAETDKPSWVLVSRDDAMVFLMPCGVGGAGRRDEVFYAWRRWRRDDLACKRDYLSV